MRDRPSGDVPTPSRRTLIGVAASPLLAGAAFSSPVDRTITVCEIWRAKNAEIDQLQQQWGEIEAWLGRHHSWYDLSEEERRLLPGAKALQAIDARMDRLTDQRDRLGASLASLPATNLTAIAAKLSVAAAQIGPEDHPQAHQLVVAATQEIAALTAAHLPGSQV